MADRYLHYVWMAGSWIPFLYLVRLIDYTTIEFFVFVAVMYLLNVVICPNTCTSEMPHIIYYYCPINCASLALTDYKSHFNEVG